MGKEVKIGLSVIAVLLSVFGGVLYTRLRGVGDAGPTAEAKESKKKDKDPKSGDQKKAKEPKAKETKKNKPTFKSGPEPNAKLASKDRADRYSTPSSKSSSSKKRPKGREAALDDTDDNEGSRDAVTDGYDFNTKNESPKGSRYDRRSGDRYRSPDDVDDADTSSDAAGASDSSATDDATDDRSADPDAPGQDGTNDILSDAPELDRFDGAGNSGSGGYGKRTRPTRDDELESVLPPSELEPDDAETPLTSDDSDPSAIKRLGGDRSGRGLREVLDRRSFSTVSSRGAAESRPADDGIAPGEAEDLDIEGETYTVRPNDNYWTISQRVYGTGSYFKALKEFNRDRYPNPDRLDVGDEVSVPEVAVLEQTYPKLCPMRRHVAAQQRTAALASTRSRGGSGGKVYTVADGDTLFDIARRELGSAERWAEILDLNRDQLGDDIHYLSPGTRLTLPGDGQDAARAEERITTRPRAGNSRR